MFQKVRWIPRIRNCTTTSSLRGPRFVRPWGLISSHIFLLSCRRCSAQRDSRLTSRSLVESSFLTFHFLLIIPFAEGEGTEEREGWETINIDGQALGIRTSVIEEKCQAFETLIIYCSTLNARFAPYMAQTLEVTLPGLKFYFHEGVREACAM